MLSRHSANTSKRFPTICWKSVTEDYVWLAGLVFEEVPRHTDFRQRRECCREECRRRGIPQLYELAESLVAPRAA